MNKAVTVTVITSDLTLADGVKAIDVFSSPDGLDPYVEQVRQELAEFEPDTSTAKGRKEITSMAYKVSQLKTKLDDMGKELTADWKKQAKAVDDSRKSMRDQMDVLRDETKAPLIAWEKAEQERIEAITARLDVLRNMPIAGADTETLDNLADYIVTDSDFDYQEFEASAEEFTNDALKRISEEREAIEARRIEAEKAEAERVEQANRFAKEKAEREAAEAKMREQQAEIDRLNAEKAEAEQAARQAREAQERAEREAEEEKARAEREAAQRAEAEKAAAERAEAERIEAEKQAAEQQRKAEVEAKARAERREQSLAEIVEALKPYCSSNAAGKRLADTIVAGNIPHVSAEV